MTTIADAFATLDEIRQRLESESTATTQDIAQAEATVQSAYQALTADIAAAHKAMTASVDKAFGQVLRDLQAIRELRTTAIADAIGPEPVQIDHAEARQIAAE